MSLLIQQDDFSGSAGTLSGGLWTLPVGSWTRDGIQVYPSSAPATLSHARASAFNPGPLLSSASSPITITYEADITLPSTLPASGDVIQGVSFCNPSSGTTGMELRYERLSGGATTQVQLLIRSSTSTVSLYTVFAPTAFTARAAGATMTLKAEVRFSGGGFVVIGYLDGTQLFISSPSYALLNSTTGNSYGATSGPMYGGLVASVAGTATGSGGPQYPGYFDRWRVRDAGSATAINAMSQAPTLTTAPTLTPISVYAENDTGAETLTLQPSYAMQLADQFEVDEFVSDSGHAVLMAKQTRARRRWNLHWDAIGSSGKSTLETLWSALNTTKKAFTWTENETGSTITVRFVGAPTISRIAPNVYSASAVIMEVF